MSKFTYIVRNEAGKIITTRTTAREYRFSNGHSFSANQQDGFKYPVEIVTTDAQKAEIKEFKRALNEEVMHDRVNCMMQSIDACVKAFNAGDIESHTGALSHAGAVMRNAKEAIKHAKKAKVQAPEDAIMFASFESKQDLFAHLGLVEAPVQEEAQEEAFVTEPEAEVKAILDAIDADTSIYCACANAYNNAVQYKAVINNHAGYNFVNDFYMGIDLSDYHPVIKPVMQYLFDNCDLSKSRRSIFYINSLFKIAGSMADKKGTAWANDRLERFIEAGIPARVIWLVADLIKYLK